MTQAAFMDLSEADQQSFLAAVRDHWANRYTEDKASYFDGDDRREGTYRRTDWGE